MKPDWLKSRKDEHWTALLGPYEGSVARTMFGSYSYAVSDSVRVLRADNADTLEVARLAAEGAAEGLAGVTKT